MSNRLAALVAYGDSDSDEEVSSVKTAVPSVKKGLVSYGPQDAEDEEEGDHSNSPKKPERPGPMDTVSSHPTPPAGSSTGATTAVLGSKAVADRVLKSEWRASSPSTPLPPDHSAAADVANTPTINQSPRIQHSPDNAVPIDEDRREHPGSDREVLMRQLLKPKPIQGVTNYGIPPEPEDECDPGLQEKIKQFYNIKMARGIHFNQSLMKNKNFRNPHIYQSLVELVELDETGSNFEKGLEFFDFKGYPPEAYAVGLAAAQDKAQELLARQQQPGTRTHLQFVHGTAGALAQGTVLPMASGINAQHQAALAAASGVAAKIAASYSHHSSHTSSASAASSTTLAGASGAGRSGRKSKWDTGAPGVAPSTTGEQVYKKPRH